MTQVGTLSWAHRTGGKLSRLDQVALAKQFVLARLLQKNIKNKGRVANVDIDQIRIPDSQIAQRAIAVCRELSEDWLTNHNYRAYLWGAFLGKASGIIYDEELLFVSCILHDLGLTDVCKPERVDGHCFAVIGARKAAQEMANCGWSQQRLDAMEEAVALHLNVSVPASQGIEAHLLHDGTTLDVMGARHNELSPHYISSVLERHPRGPFKENITACCVYESEVRKNSRIAFHIEQGFLNMVTRAPFES